MITRATRCLSWCQPYREGHTSSGTLTVAKCDGINLALHPCGIGGLVILVYRRLLSAYIYFAISACVEDSLSSHVVQRVDHG